VYDGKPKPRFREVFTVCVKSSHESLVS
jgi:hypothetical protein